MTERTHHILTVAIALLSTAILIGCGQEDDQPEQPREIPDYDFPVQVQATDTDDQPVAAVPVLLDGETVGFTDDDGEFEGTLRAKPTDTVELSIEEPDGYRLTNDQSNVEQTLQITESLDGQFRGIPVRLRPDFQSLLNEYFVWIELECDDRLNDHYCEQVPIELDGELQTHTDSRGQAHFTFETSPGNAHEISVPMIADHPEDERDDIPEIEPTDPVYELEADARGAVYHIAEEFTDPDARRPVRTARPSPEPEPDPDPPGEADDEADEPEDDDDEDDDSGIIQLF